MMRRVGCFVGLMVLASASMHVHAAGSSTAPSGSTSVGRLFLTPEQRQELDGLRKPQAKGEISAGSRLDGIMRRSEGRTVVWIDGVPQFESSLAPLKGSK